MIKLLNTEKAVLRKDYRFDEAFSIFDEIGNKHKKLNDYNLVLDRNINNNI